MKKIIATAICLAFALGALPAEAKGKSHAPKAPKVHSVKAPKGK